MKNTVRRRRGVAEESRGGRATTGGARQVGGRDGGNERRRAEKDAESLSKVRVRAARLVRNVSALGLPPLSFQTLGGAE